MCGDLFFSCDSGFLFCWNRSDPEMVLVDGGAAEVTATGDVDSSLEWDIVDRVRRGERNRARNRLGANMVAKEEG